MSEMVEVPREYLERLERQDEYLEKFDASEEYQDFIVDQLMRRGIVINQYSSKKYQNDVGESALGIEVKFDMRLHETGNVYIEVAERKSPDKDFVPSGVLRNDNSWLFLIGNYDRALLLSKKHMRLLLKEPDAKLSKLGIRRCDKETSQGYVIAYEPLSRSTCCLKEFHFEDGMW